MSIFIKSAESWLNQRPHLKQWAWFAALWLGGLLAVGCVAYPIKLIIKSMG